MKGVLNTRYAEALLRIAFRRGQVQEYSEYLETMCEVFEKDPLLLKMFNNPRIAFAIKEEIIDSLTEVDEYSSYFANFLKILTEHGRTGMLPGILREFIVLARSYYDVLTITIETPVELTDEQISQVRQKCALKFNVNKIREIVIKNESLIGGMKIIAGNTVLDNSLKKQLDDIDKLMKD